MRVYQLAKELNISNKDLIDKLTEKGYSAGSHMSVVSDKAIEEFKSGGKAADRSQKEAVPEVTKVASDKESPTKPPVDSSGELREEIFDRGFSSSGRGTGSIKPGAKGPGQSRRRSAASRRRAKNKKRGLGGSRHFQQKEVTEVAIDSDMLLSKIPELIGKTIPEVVMAFMKKGHAYTANKIVPRQEIVELCKDFGIEVLDSGVASSSSTSSLRAQTDTEKKADLRRPVVVVMGHVDHGKTTLLDHIRKASVASGEDGGITQKISAYQVKTAVGEIVFIDTPGHEAFSLMRSCGAKITDIALIVIAADDGIMPQTEEAIELAKKAGSQIIIALNKIDKPGVEKNVETIKSQLSSKHDILVEEWGGETILLPISAKTGQGVDDLMEMLALQSEMMSLKASKDVSARAFVLESHFQKGYGPVSTVIVTEGELKRGDSFLCGDVQGKVRFMEDFSGKVVKVVGPSSLAKIIGFPSLADPGMVLRVVDQKQALKAKRDATGFVANSGASKIADESDSQVEDKGKVRVSLKVGTGGSLDALLKAFEACKDKNQEVEKRLIISGASVGDVSCRDILSAEDADSMMLVFATGVERKAAEMASEKGIKIENFSIIYKLVERVEEMVKEKADQETVYREVGRATVIQVFNIKGRGVIAGSKVIEGKVVKNGRVICMRDGEKVAEGDVSSLQHVRKTVSEVKKGFECGLICNNFGGWQEGDTVICLEPVKRGAV